MRVFILVALVMTPWLALAATITVVTAKPTTSIIYVEPVTACMRGA